MHRARASNGLSEIMDDIFRMPETMRGLAVVQFLRISQTLTEMP